jgi:hypothetical protein
VFSASLSLLLVGAGGVAEIIGQKQSQLYQQRPGASERELIQFSLFFVLIKLNRTNRSQSEDVLGCVLRFNLSSNLIGHLFNEEGKKTAPDKERKETLNRKHSHTQRA